MKLSFLKNRFTAVFTLVALLAVAVAAQAPQVTLRALDGGTFNPTAQQGKVVVLSFGATYVPMAAKELPALQKLADRYAGRNVQFYWVSINGAKPGAPRAATDAELQAFAQKNGLRVGVLRDAEQSAYRALGGDGLPTIVVIGRDGQVKLKRAGFDPDQPEPYGDVIRALDQLAN
jgi:cytochrome c biogenesis protein CcmG, thiol:disulfide interchange protein DsbE